MSTSSYVFLVEAPNLSMFLLLLVKIVFTDIVGPTKLEGLVGDDVIFKWNTTNGTEILSAAWGIHNGDTPDPQFINVNALTGKPIISDLPEQYIGRVEFIGNLKQGHAWFVIRNLNMNDTNDYIARISEKDVSKLRSYSVRLIVKDRPDYFTTFSTLHFASTSNTSTTKAPSSSQTPPPTSSQATSTTSRVAFSFSLILFLSGLKIVSVDMA